MPVLRFGLRTALAAGASACLATQGWAQQPAPPLVASPVVAVTPAAAIGAPAPTPGVPTDQPPPRFVNKGPGAPKGRSDSGDAYSTLRAISQDPAYGYTREKPIAVGGAREHTDVRASLYLNALRGPAGEPLAYVRLGTCCYFTPLTGVTGASGLLNVYQLTYAGRAEPFLLYLDIYDTEPARVPVGLTARP